MRVLALTLVLLFSGTPALAQSNCNAYSGWEALAEKATSHVIMFGEQHGTNESAGAIGSFLCELVAADVPIRFGVEAGHDQSVALDAALTWPIDRDAVLAAGPDMWSTPDGRGSEAIYRLLSALALWRSAGANISVFAFDSTFEETDKDMRRAAVMAREVDTALKGFDGAVVLFAGNYHTRLNPPVSGRTGGSLASEVTQRPVTALEMRHAGGEIYATVSFNGSEAKPGIYAFDNHLPADAAVRVFDLTPTPTQSGFYYTGPITASPPAFPEAIKAPPEQ